MAEGLTRLVEEDLSRGMFPSLAPERIPKGGCFDITNGLLDEQNVVYRRGGTTFLNPFPRGEPRLLWSGLLKHGGQQTLLATPEGLFNAATGALLSGAVIPAVLTRGQALEGVLYLPGGVTWDGEKEATLAEPRARKAFYATAGGRLLAGEGSSVYFSQVPTKENEELTWAETDFHQLPEGAEITGMQGLRTSCVVFTTEGIWVIGNLEKELTDAEGNIQQTLDVYAPNAVLWGNNGVAASTAGLVVPCKDNIYLMELGVSSEKAQPFVAVSQAIENVYRGYVEGGYMPGVAAVKRGTYFLPIMRGASVVDMLSCRIDATDGRGRRTFPWTHQTGYGAAVAALVVTDEESALLGASAGLGRVLGLSSYFTPSSTYAKDADGSDHPFTVTYRDLVTGNLVPNLVVKARLSYRMSTTTGVLRMAVGATSFAGVDWDEFDWDEADWASEAGPFTVLEGSAKADPEALTPYVWPVRRKVRYVRVKVYLEGPANDVSLRALELAVRLDGRVW